MTQVLGDLLPAAIGIAVSPVPVIAVVLMLLAPRARAASVGFLVGWLAGILAASAAFVLLTDSLPDQDAGDDQPVRGTLLLVLGVLLVLLAVRTFRNRADARTPAWMSALDTLTTTRAAATGAALAALNPKNLTMAAAAGLAISSAGLSTAATAGTLLLFTALAGASVAVPVLAYLAAPGRMAAPLASLKDWLMVNNATVTAVLLLVLGVVVAGNGLERL